MKPSLIFFLMMFGTCLYSQERNVRVDRGTFRIRELGQGPVTVIFESGMSDSIEVWGDIPDSVAKYARVFLYDRAGVGKSESIDRKRTIPNMVDELHSILENRSIDPPYILVGHSLGGLITRYYSDKYPSEVKGLLLLDPAPESYWNNMSKRELKKYIKGGNKWYETKFPERYRGEWYEFIPNLEYMNDLHIDPDLPVILVSATAWNWYEFHEDILDELENAKHLELEGEHHIYKQHPDLVIQYILKLIYYAQDH